MVGKPTDRLCGGAIGFLTQYVKNLLGPYPYCAMKMMNVMVMMIFTLFFQVVGRLAVKTLCDSWLEHIYQKKFKFR